MAKHNARPIRAAGAVYTEEELGAILHAGSEVLRALRQSGQLRFLKVGRRIVYPDQYVQEFIDRGGRMSADPPADRIALVRGR
jgi:hypothetical protein